MEFYMSLGGTTDCLNFTLKTIASAPSLVSPLNANIQLQKWIISVNKAIQNLSWSAQITMKQLQN